MSLQNLLFLFFFGEFVKNVTTFNPLLTYTLRFHKLHFIPNMTGNYTINQYREQQFLNVNVKIDSNKLINKIIITFYRCNQEGINCEYFQSWKMSELCLKLKEKNQLWSRFVESIVPPLVCPFDKVYYRLINGTLDIGVTLALYPEATDYSWKVNLNYYDEDTLVGGFGGQASFFGYRKRNKSPYKNKN